jgi:putative two-component system response regulator
VLVVDDAPDNRVLLSALLKDTYEVQEAEDGETALDKVASPEAPDLVLLDISMPGLDGYEVCRRLKADPGTAKVPVIFLTALTQPTDERRGFDVGAVDYVTKPVSAPILLARVKTHLELGGTRAALENQNAYLEEEVRRRMAEIMTIQEVAMVAMGSLAETRDNETGSHIRRTQEFVRLLINAAGDLPEYREQLSEEARRLIVTSTPLHDIGKVGIPDSILRKPGKLTTDEFESMKKHTTLGRDAIAAAEKLLDDRSSFLRHAREIALSHHEKWDGTGYPEGIAGDRIPLSARVMAVADVYDALISRRVYKAPMPHEEALGIIRTGAGAHFDPGLVEVFLGAEASLRAVGQRHAGAE